MCRGAAGPILQQIQQVDAERVLDLADLDLFVSELNFVFGLADPVSGRAVIALPRLRESFYGGARIKSLSWSAWKWTEQGA